MKHSFIMKHSLMLPFIFAFLFTSLLQCKDSNNSPTAIQEDNPAGDIAMSAMAAIAINDLGINFLGTECIISNHSTHCTAPIHQTTSISSVRTLIDNLIEEDVKYTPIKTRGVFEREALYESNQRTYHIRFLLENKRIRMILTEVYS